MNRQRAVVPSSHPLPSYPCWPVPGVRKTATKGQAGRLYTRLFWRPEGEQVLFVYDKESSPTVQVSLDRGARVAYQYALNGTFSGYDDFDGHTLHDVHLDRGNAAIFTIR